MESKTTSALKRFLGHFHLGKSKKDGGKDGRALSTDMPTTSPPATRRRAKRSHPEPRSSSPSFLPPDLQDADASAGGEEDGPEERSMWQSPAGGSAARTPIDGLGGHDFKDSRDVMDKVLGMNEDEAADEETLMRVCTELLRKAKAERMKRPDDDTLAAVRAAFEFSKFLSNDNAETKRLCQAQLMHAIEANDKAATLAYEESASAARHRTALYYSTVA